MAGSTMATRWQAVSTLECNLGHFPLLAVSEEMLQGVWCRRESFRSFRF
jgi:hypothetical protein